MLTEEARRHRASYLLLTRTLGKTPHAEAWRVVYPNAKCTDASAGELVRREIRWFKETRARERAPFARMYDVQTPESEPVATVDEPPPQKMKRCEGVAGRQCEQEVPAVRNRKRCATCSKENRKLQKRGYGREYYRDHRVRLCKDLRDRRNGTIYVLERLVEKRRFLTEEVRNRYVRQLGRELRTALALEGVVPAGTTPDTVRGQDDQLYKYNKKKGRYERLEWGME